MIVKEGYAKIVMPLKVETDSVWFLNVANPLRFFFPTIRKRPQFLCSVYLLKSPCAPPGNLFKKKKLVHCHCFLKRGGVDWPALIASEIQL